MITRVKKLKKHSQQAQTLSTCTLLKTYQYHPKYRQSIFAITWHSRQSKIYLILNRIYHIIENDIRLSTIFKPDRFKSFSDGRHRTVYKRKKRKALQCVQRKSWHLIIGSNIVQSKKIYIKVAITEGGDCQVQSWYLLSKMQET